MNIMIAGRDTVRETILSTWAQHTNNEDHQTAATLTFSAYSMAMYPDITRRLREEILEKVGSSRNPTYEDIREMKYLRAFINGLSITWFTSTEARFDLIRIQRLCACTPLCRFTIPHEDYLWQDTHPTLFSGPSMFDIL